MVAEWLRRCATSRTVPGSIPGGVTGFLSDIFPSDRSMAVGSTKLPSENEYQKYPYAVVTKFGNLNFSEPSGPLQACNGTALLFI